MSQHEEGLSIVVVGASGDLARKKIFPALFSLYCQNYLPERFQVFGFARSGMDDAEFRQRITEHLTCRYAPGESCAERMDEFLARCHYLAGRYDSTDSFLDLFMLMREREGSGRANRVYYLAIPPSVFLDVAHSIGNAGLVSCSTDDPWSRVVIEKPFGRDRASSDELADAMAQVFIEPQTYRIDHYLGKEVIQNLMVLRFANLVFEPVWNRQYIRAIRILWKENLSTEGRGGYFDQFGIIRDVCQNHLLQILALVAMEPPARFNARNIAMEKARVLHCVPPVELDDVVLGQYTASEDGGRRRPAYVEDPTVPDDSRTATYAAARLRIDNPRWQGVPILMEAGKGLDARMTEIRIEFRGTPAGLFADLGIQPEANELVIRVQPDEAIQLSIVNKVPGMGMKVASRPLDLRYKAAFTELIPEAYESLLMDVVRGDRSLFIHREELQAAWDIFTPLLAEIDRLGVLPELYPFGAARPEGARRLLP